MENNNEKLYNEKEVELAKYATKIATDINGFLNLNLDTLDHIMEGINGFIKNPLDYPVIDIKGIMNLLRDYNDIRDRLIKISIRFAKIV